MNPILIVDDEAIVRDSIGDWLRTAGYKVEEAESGEQALDLISKQDFSILILDIRLPGKSGVQVLREVKTAKPSIRTIIITAFPYDGMAEEVLGLGAVDYLIKPVHPENLEKIILETLNKYEKQSNNN